MHECIIIIIIIMWAPHHKPYGPIGILLCQAHEKATAIPADFVIHSHGWPPTHIFDGPYCELKPFAYRTAAAARTAAATNTRKTATDLHDIEEIATNSSITKHVKGDVGLLRLVQQGAAWDAHITNKNRLHG